MKNYLGLIIVCCIDGFGRFSNFQLIKNRNTQEQAFSLDGLSNTKGRIIFMIKLIPIEKYYYTLSPLTEIVVNEIDGQSVEAEVYKDGVIEVTESDFELIGMTKKFDDGQVVDMTIEEINERQELFQSFDEQKNREKRQEQMQFYNMYQAAVSYGQFEKSPEVDDWAKKARDKDWESLNELPPQLGYFAGEISLAQSGLVIIGD